MKQEEVEALLTTLSQTVWINRMQLDALAAVVRALLLIEAPRNGESLVLAIRSEFARMQGIALNSPIGDNSIAAQEAHLRALLPESLRALI